MRSSEDGGPTTQEIAVKKLAGVQLHPNWPHIPGEQESRGKMGAIGAPAKVAAGVVPSSASVEDSMKVAGVVVAGST
jgi:hypothetical protein